MKNDNRIFNALSGLDDSHFREDEFESLDVTDSGSGKRKLSGSIRIALSMAAAAAVLGISITAGAAATSGFTKKSGYDRDFRQPTVEFSAANSEGAPSVIEKYYLPSELPEYGEYIYSAVLDDKKTNFIGTYIDITPENPLVVYDVIRLRQWTKAEFSRTYGVPKDHVEVRETNVGGCPGYLITGEHYYGYSTYVIWDNGDYILELSGFLKPEDAMRLAESVSVDNNALEKGENV